MPGADAPGQNPLAFRTSPAKQKWFLQVLLICPSDRVMDWTAWRRIPSQTTQHWWGSQAGGAGGFGLFKTMSGSRHQNAINGRRVPWSFSMRTGKSCRQPSVVIGGLLPVHVFQERLSSRVCVFLFFLRLVLSFIRARRGEGAFGDFFSMLYYVALAA